MSYILLVDESDVAARAMHGVLARGQHTCIVAKSCDEAWRLLRDGVIFDLVILELKLSRGDGSGLLQRVRDDWFLKQLPVLVYTSENDPKQVKRALGYGVQNYLLKPYHDESILVEIAKAQAQPWRERYFAASEAFCDQHGHTRMGLNKLRGQVMSGFAAASREFPLWAGDRQNEEVFARIDKLTQSAQAAGISAGLDFLQELRAQAERTNWPVFKTCEEPLDYAHRLIFHQLNPKHIPDCLHTEQERMEKREAEDRKRWETADVDASGPPVTLAELEKQAIALPGCPVIETAAAAFEMAADGRSASMSHIMYLVTRDPGLCAQVLITTNRNSDDEFAMIDDSQVAATQLGELKLAALVRTLPVIPERHLRGGPLPWTSFWMFVLGTGRIAEFICDYLELSHLSSRAFTAGLLHELGKSVLIKLQPFGYQAALRYARDRKVPLAVAEKKHFGGTSRELGVAFAENVKLPAVYKNVIRWAEQPELATADHALVAMVALARHVALHQQLGHCGETPPALVPSIGGTIAWRQLRAQTFPGFDLRKFETQLQAHCAMLRRELSGHAERAKAMLEPAALAGR